MDQALLSTISALAGTVVGGVTSFATSYFQQQTQSKAERLAKEVAGRQELYGKFLEETARLYSFAVREDVIDYAHLVDIFALRGRILLISSPEVTQQADSVIKALVDLYMTKNVTDAYVRDSLDRGPDKDPMVSFARACRGELQRMR